MIRQSFNDRTRIVNFFCRMIPNKSPSNEQRSKDNLKRGSNYQAKHFFLFKSVSYVYCSSMRLLNRTKDQLCAHLIGYLYGKKHD